MPRITGLQPVYIVRQLICVQIRSSVAVATTKKVVVNLSEDDIIAISVCLGSVPTREERCCFGLFSFFVLDSEINKLFRYFSKFTNEALSGHADSRMSQSGCKANPKCTFQGLARAFGSSIAMSSSRLF